MSTFNERLARAYMSAGHEVEIVTFSLQYPSFLFPGKTQYSEEPAPEDLTIKVLVNSINPISWWVTAKYLVDTQADFFIFRYWMPFMAPCLGFIAKWSKWRGAKAKTIAIADNIIPHEKFPLARPLTAFFLRQMDAVHTLSEAVSSDLKTFDYPGEHKLLKHPLYDNYGEKLERKAAIQALGLKEDYTYFLFFGFIRQYKGLDLLLQAFADTRLKTRKVKLIVAGEFYENPDRYYRLIREHNLADRIEMHTHFIADDQVKYYFSAASLVTQTYHHATQSGVTQVGFQFNSPMLVTKVGGLSELVDNGHSGYVCEPVPSQIADCMVDFIDNNRYESMSEKVAIKKKEFSWEIFSSTLLE